MNSDPIHVLLADDDADDCLFFKEALEELGYSTSLEIAHNGEQLMNVLAKKVAPVPHVLFLDLNIPRKNGLECLLEIKSSKDLHTLFVVIISTSAEQDIVNLLYKSGAQHYIRKPAEFSQLKKVIHRALSLVAETLAGGTGGHARPTLKESFVITGDL
jgi:CheY-like chemotaxis protein